MDHRAELAEFLRARRDAVTPEQVGLPRGPGRRTPGLRREEVAMLAGVSVTWYTWLEQGRRPAATAARRQPDLFGGHRVTPGPEELGELGAVIARRAHVSTLPRRAASAEPGSSCTRASSAFWNCVIFMARS